MLPISGYYLTSLIFAFCDIDDLKKGPKAVYEICLSLFPYHLYDAKVQTFKPF